MLGLKLTSLPSQSSGSGSNNITSPTHDLKGKLWNIAGSVLFKLLTPVTSKSLEERCAIVSPLLLKTRQVTAEVAGLRDFNSAKPTADLCSFEGTLFFSNFHLTMPVDLASVSRQLVVLGRMTLKRSFKIHPHRYLGSQWQWRGPCAGCGGALLRHIR